MYPRTLSRAVAASACHQYRKSWRGCQHEYQGPRILTSNILSQFIPWQVTCRTRNYTQRYSITFPPSLQASHRDMARTSRTSSRQHGSNPEAWVPRLSSRGICWIPVCSLGMGERLFHVLLACPRINGHQKYHEYVLGNLLVFQSSYRETHGRKLSVWDYGTMLVTRTWLYVQQCEMTKTSRLIQVVLGSWPHMAPTYGVILLFLKYTCGKLS